jgi:hypothetical protein
MREMTVMKTPALAVVGPDRQIVRSTEGFRHYENAVKVAQRSPELECVLTGYADAATIKFGDLKMKVEAITDASGRRQARLTLPPVAAPVTDAVLPREESGPMLELDKRHVSATPPLDPDEAVPEITAEEIPVSRPTEVVAATPSAPSPTLAETAQLLQSNLELARLWADRSEALQEELRQAQAATARAAEEANRWRAELEEAKAELASARAEADALRESSAEALKVSDELDQTVMRLRSWLGDFETALEPQPALALAR